jgi:hypothetical protein
VAIFATEVSRCSGGGGGGGGGGGWGREWGRGCRGGAGQRAGGGIALAEQRACTASALYITSTRFYNRQLSLLLLLLLLATIR